MITFKQWRQGPNEHFLQFNSSLNFTPHITHFTQYGEPLYFNASIVDNANNVYKYVTEDNVYGEDVIITKNSPNGEVILRHKEAEYSTDENIQNIPADNSLPTHELEEGNLEIKNSMFFHNERFMFNKYVDCLPDNNNALIIRFEVPESEDFDNIANSESIYRDDFEELKIDPEDVFNNNQGKVYFVYEDEDEPQIGKHYILYSNFYEVFNKSLPTYDSQTEISRVRDSAAYNDIEALYYIRTAGVIEYLALPGSRLSADNFFTGNYPHGNILYINYYPYRVTNKRKNYKVVVDDLEITLSHNSNDNEHNYWGTIESFWGFGNNSIYDSNVRIDYIGKDNTVIFPDSTFTRVPDYYGTQNRLYPGEKYPSYLLFKGNIRISDL